MLFDCALVLFVWCISFAVLCFVLLWCLFSFVMVGLVLLGFSVFCCVVLCVGVFPFLYVVCWLCVNPCMRRCVAMSCYVLS